MNTAERPRCSGTRRDGQPCGASPGTDGLCLSHSPRYSDEEKRSWARSGALVNIKKQNAQKLEAAQSSLAEVRSDETLPELDTPAKIRQFLATTAMRVSTRQITPSTASALTAIAKLAAEVVSLELEDRLLSAEIEQQERAERGDRS